MVRTTPHRVVPEEDSLDLLSHYLGIDRKAIYLVVTLLATASVIAVGIYVACFGFENWKKNMGRAGDMMVINFDTPVTGVRGPSAQNPAPIARTQFFCPTCGLTGNALPGLGSTPLCPSCGAVMSASGGLGAGPNLWGGP